MPAVRRVDYVQVGQRGKRAIFAPRGHDVPGWSAVRFVPNGDRAQQFALVYLPDDVAIPGSTKLCDSLTDRESPALRRAVEDVAGKAVEVLPSRERTQAQAADLVASLFFGGPWNPIEPTSKGEYELLLAGQKVWSRLAIRGGATDNFNRANETPLSGGGNWDSGYADWGTLNLASNAITASATGTDCAARWLANTFTGFGQYSQIDVPLVSGAFAMYGGAGVRMHPSSTTDESCYLGYQAWDGGSGSYAMYEASSAFGFTLLTSTTTGYSSAAATFRQEADGSSLALKRNGTNVLTTTDTTLSEATYTRVGVAQFRDYTLSLDNWEGGDLNPPVGGTVRRYSLSLTGVG